MGFRSTSVPGTSFAEVHCWENAMSFDVEMLRSFLTEWLKRSAVNR